MIFFALGCGGSDTSSGGGGCGSSGARCEIDPDSTVCGDRIAVACFDGGTPEAASQCEKALEESGESLYCCSSAAAEGTAQGTAEGASAAGSDASSQASTGAAGGAAAEGEGGGGADAEAFSHDGLAFHRPLP